MNLTPKQLRIFEFIRSHRASKGFSPTMQEIADEGAGVVVPVTVDGLEYGLRRLLSLDDEALAEMGRRAAEIVAVRYTWESVAQRLIAAYDAELAARS